MDINPLKQYYEENIRKGYTVDQVSNNLKNSGYTDDVINSAKSALGKDVLDLSTKNASMFDYSKLPGNLKNKIQAPQQQGSPQNPQQVAQQNSQQFPAQNATPAVEKHPGLDKDSMIKYGSIVGGVLLVIIVASIIFAAGGDDMSRDVSSGRTDVGAGLDDEVDVPDYEQDPYEEEDEDFSSSEPTYNETNASDEENQSIVTNETSQNATEEEADNTEDDEEVSGKFCELDEDCFDGDLLTIRYCDDNNRCSLKLDDGRECISGDEFCPPRCYGYDTADEDCVDEEERNLCETDEHCDDGDEWTEGQCRSGVCMMFDIEKPNNPPTITSTPANKTLAYELYEYQVTAEDEDNDTITFSLNNAPSNMTINSTTGLLEWYPSDDDYSSGIFYVVASDGKGDEDEQSVLVLVFMDEEDDAARQSCDTDKSCYLTKTIFDQEHKKCKYIDYYWETGMEEVYDCIETIAKNTGDTNVCNYIYDSSAKSRCLDGIE